MSPIQVLMLLLNFSDELGTYHTNPQFMKVQLQKKMEKVTTKSVSLHLKMNKVFNTP